VQHFTVPSSVSALTITAVGSAGSRATYGGKGGLVVGTFTVTPSSVLDVYVGGNSGYSSAGWPDGGNGDIVYGSGTEVTGSGGSSQVRPSGSGSVSDALIVAAGGGGAGASAGGVFPVGGDGGLYAGGNAGTTIYTATGATQSVPGIGGTTYGYGIKSGEDGDTGFLGKGGNAGNTTNFFAFPGGGGGGGWHGGGGAPDAGGSGNYAGGGGGGSGWIDPGTGTLSTYTDGYNTGKGYVIIEWVW
jgi:hypothetical protein